MKLPEITIKKKGPKYMVMCLGHCYGEYTSEGPAQRLLNTMEHYRNLATMELLCQGLDGESSAIGPVFVPLTAEQVYKLSQYSNKTVLIDPDSGATFYVDEIDIQRTDSAFLAAGLTVTVTAHNWEGES